MPGKVYGVVLHLALVALCGVTLLLVQQNRELRNVLTPNPPPIKTGYTAAATEVAGLDGTVRTLSWPAAERDHLLLVFTTTCPACQDNQGPWQALHERLGEDLDVLGVSLDPVDATVAYREEQRLPFQTVAATNREAFVEAFDISAVPFTVHIGSDGKVHGAWRGVLSSKQIGQIEASVQNHPS